MSTVVVGRRAASLGLAGAALWCLRSRSLVEALAGIIVGVLVFALGLWLMARRR